MNTTRLLALLTLAVGCVNCYSWDIIMAVDKHLDFYENGTITHTEEIPSIQRITSTFYDPVQNRLLYSDYMYPDVSIYSLDLSTREIKLLIRKKANAFGVRVVYDPLTQLFFWKEGRYIYSYSVNPASSNRAEDANALFTLDRYCYDIAVDSCGGFIYWTTSSAIERARFDGSNREVLINTYGERLSLTIDQQAQRMYWLELIKDNYEFKLNIESADLKGQNKKTLFVVEYERHADALAVSKDYIYWRGYDLKSFWKLPKNQQQHGEAKVFEISNKFDYYNQVIAAKYTIMELTEGNENCGNLKSLVQSSTDTKPTEHQVSALCVHGTEVDGESRCECTQGYTGDRCEVSICNNYCLRGDCSVSAEGQPECRCNAGYSGDRCEVDVCHMFCLNNADCSVNERHEPVCDCPAGYEGERCEVGSTRQHIVQDVRTELRQAIQQELQRALRCFSDKINE